jgi:hypothetical protein
MPTGRGADTGRSVLRHLPALAVADLWDLRTVPALFDLADHRNAVVPQLRRPVGALRRLRPDAPAARRDTAAAALRDLHSTGAGTLAILPRLR